MLLFGRRHQITVVDFGYVVLDWAARAALIALFADLVTNCGAGDGSNGGALVSLVRLVSDDAPNDGAGGGPGSGAFPLVRPGLASCQKRGKGCERTDAGGPAYRAAPS